MSENLFTEEDMLLEGSPIIAFIPLLDLYFVKGGSQ